MADKMNTAEASALLLAQVDKPYVWGANGPDKFDCSGMFYWWSNATGNARSDTTAQGLYNLSVATNSPRLGDLAFLYSGGYISHVGIMLDSDTVIEARGRAYGVDKTPLASFKNRPGYIWKGVRRIQAFTLQANAPTIPVTKQPRLFRFGQANWEAERFGGLDDDSASIGVFMRDMMNCSLYVLCEVSESRRNAIRKVLGSSRYLTYPYNYVATMWDDTKWEHALDSASDHVSFGTAIHGAQRAKLQDRSTKLYLDIISVHPRPTSIAPESQKMADIAKAFTLVRKGVPTIIAGDWNTAHAVEVATKHGMIRATKAVDTLDNAGTQAYDAVFITPDLEMRGQMMLDPGNRSDHKVWVYNGTLGKESK